MKQEIKIKRLLESIKKIIEATLGKEVEVTSGSDWDFSSDISGKIQLKVNTNSILTKRWKYNLSYIFTLIGHSLFTTVPNDYVIRLKENLEEEHSFAISTLEELRIQQKMMYEFPGTKDFFFYSFKLDNDNISTESENQLLKHRKFIYDIRKDFYKEKVSNIEEYLKIKEEILNCKDLDKLMKVFDKKLSDYYFSLYEKKEGNKDTSQDMNDMLENLHTETKQTDEEGEIEKELNDLIGVEEDTKIGSNTKEYTEIYNTFYHLIPKFVRKLNSILKDNSLSRMGGNFRSGKLNTNKLYKIETNNNRIFNRKLDRKHKKYIVGLLIDCSGSMKSGKDLLAVKSACLMAEVLTKVGIPFEIVGFNSYYKVFKSINQKFDKVAKQNIISSLNDNFGVEGNNDGYAIRKINYDIMKEDGEKIIITLSDGLPTPDGKLNEAEQKLFKKANYSDFNLLEEVNKASLYSKVIGIGIQDNAVTKFYKDNIVIWNIETLPEILLNKLKNNIKRG